MEMCEFTRNVVVFGRNKKDKTALLFNPSCGSWSCDYCSENLKENWIHQAGRGAMLLASEDQTLHFVTLTSRGYATPNKSIYFFKQNWPKLRKRIAHRTNKQTDSTGVRFAYFMVPERTKYGVLHAHLIVSTHISEKSEWKKHAHKTGFGYMIDVQELVSPLLCSNYISKYLHKGMGAEVWPKGFRRVRHSQNWPIDKPKKDANWQYETYVRSDTIWTETMALIDMGWKVIDNREEK